MRGAFVGLILLAVAASSAQARDADLNAPVGGPAELAALNREIIAHPNDTALNLRYAALAEQLGLRRLALAAYERVLIYDPTNPEGQRGLDRVRYGLAPDITQYIAELGVAFESNPFYGANRGPNELLTFDIRNRQLVTINNGAVPRNEGQLLAALTVRDERTLFETRWRTVANATAQVHSEADALNYGYLGARTGPVWDVLPGITMHTALGAAGAYLDEHFYYGEGSASVTFDANPGGAYRGVMIRAAYRDYGAFFPSLRGAYLDVTGKLSFPEALGDATVVTFSPWVRWSNIGGQIQVIPVFAAVVTKINPPPFPPNVTTQLIRPGNLLEPGAYHEMGGLLEIYRAMTPWLTLGVNFSASERFYLTDRPNGDVRYRRRDVLLAPGAAAIFPNLWGLQRDLRFDYTYLSNDSNDINNTFIDHIVKATLIARF